MHPIENTHDLVHIVKPDIEAIAKAIKSDDEEKMKSIHIKIDGKYSTYIPGFGKSMYGYSYADGLLITIWGKNHILTTNVSLKED